MAEPERTLHFHPATPILRVESFKASVDYYVNKLGFSVDWEFHGFFGSVSRGSCNLMLSEGDQGNPGSWVYIGVGDIVPLHEEFRTRGAIIRMPPTNFSWAYELHVLDPDGNVLRFGSESLGHQPSGDWIDMYGRRWPGEAGQRTNA